MKIKMLAAVIGAIAVMASAIPVMAVETLPDGPYMVSKGGVLYPQTGDSSREMYRTPPNARQLFGPGTLIGVLPGDCMAVSDGTFGDYYRCDYDFAMKQEVLQDGRTVYRVIEAMR